MGNNNGNDTIRIELTPEQSEKIKAEIGRTATTIELTVEELEARIAPSYPTGPSGEWSRLAGNHNETMLVE